jgi:hypothetical protein
MDIILGGASSGTVVARGPSKPADRPGRTMAAHRRRRVGHLFNVGDVSDTPSRCWSAGRAVPPFGCAVRYASPADMPAGGVYRGLMTKELYRAQTASLASGVSAVCRSEIRASISGVMTTKIRLVAGPRLAKVCVVMYAQVAVVLVVSPDEMAHLDTGRAVAVLRQAHADLLGGIENMAYLRCPDCGARTSMFAGTPEDRTIGALGVTRLAQLPFRPGGGITAEDIRPASDAVTAYLAG